MHRSTLWFVLALVVPGVVLAQGELRFADLDSCALQSGQVIEECRLGYRVFGELDADRSNVVLVPTWFTGTTGDLVQLIGPGGFLDSSIYYVVAVDALGNGVSSSPSNSEAQLGAAFPGITIRDMVESQHRLVTEVLGLESVYAVVGFSMGGMQAFEWAVAYADFMQKVVPIIGSPRLAAYDIALWETELRILELFHQCGCPEAQAALAGVGFLASNSPAYHARETARDSVAHILRANAAAQAMTLGKAYDIASQLRAMIEHDVSAWFEGSLERAASAVQAEGLVIVGATDHVVTPEPALHFAELMGAEILNLDNDCGHSAPLCALGEVISAVHGFLRDP